MTAIPFPAMHDPFELSALEPAQIPDEPLSDRFLTSVGTAVDSAMLRAAQLVIDRAVVPEVEDLEDLRRSVVEACSPESRVDPASFYSFLDDGAIPGDVARRYERALEGGSVWRLKLVVDCEPFESVVSVDAPPRPVRLERWVHDEPTGRATILCLHGFMMGNPRIDGFAMFARDWYRLGYDVALMTLPDHGERAHGDASLPANRFATPQIELMGGVMREAICEIDQVIRWLRAETDRPVGILGLSLGAYVGALYAGLSDAPAFVIPMVGPVCIGDLAWRFLSKTRHYDDEGIPTFTRRELRTAYRIHSPLAYELQIDRSRTFIVAGRGDRVVPPEHPYALWRHWGEPEILWFSGSHTAPFRRRRVVDAIARHLEGIGL